VSSYFRERRNTELSLLYYLTTNFAADWSEVTVLRSFKQVYAKNIALPVICVSLFSNVPEKREIGSTTYDARYIISIDIFATSEGQRLDLSDYVLSKLPAGWIHYDHSHPSGDNSTLERSANGRDTLVGIINDAQINPTDTIDEKDRHRHTITIRVKPNLSTVTEGITSLMGTAFSFTATAGQTQFTLASSPTDNDSIMWLAINGIVQDIESGDYSLSGRTLTVNIALSAGDKVFGEYYA
jgi:hypothetical protein